MKHDLPYGCPCLSPRFCLASTFCSCYVSSLIYARLFKRRNFSFFGFFFFCFSAYGIRRYVVEELDYAEDYEESAIKSICCINSLTQDLHEMKLRRIGIYKYMSEPPPDPSSDYEF